MEVSHTASVGPTTSGQNAAGLGPELHDVFERVMKTQERIQTRLAKMEAQLPGGSEQRKARPQAAKGRPPAWNEEGEPRCYRCGVYGHLAKACVKRGSGNE